MAMPSPSTYAREDVERLLGYFFHKGQRWQRSDAPDSDMPKAAGNPAQRGTELAEMIDMGRAWDACLEACELLDPALLWGRFAEDLPIAAIAEALGVPRGTAEWRIYRDVDRLTLAINEGWRPGHDNTVRMWRKRAHLLRERLEEAAA